MEEIDDDWDKCEIMQLSGFLPVLRWQDIAEWRERPGCPYSIAISVPIAHHDFQLDSETLRATCIDTSTESIDTAYHTL